MRSQTTDRNWKQVSKDPGFQTVETRPIAGESQTHRHPPPPPTRPKQRAGLMADQNPDQTETQQIPLRVVFLDETQAALDLMAAQTGVGTTQAMRKQMKKILLQGTRVGIFP